jgi:hypothetical protein
LDPVAEDGILTSNTKYGSGVGNFTVGPSPGDRNHESENKGGIRNVAVDQRNLYLINGRSEQTITIPRKK